MPILMDGLFIYLVNSSARRLNLNWSYSVFEMVIIDSYKGGVARWLKKFGK